MLALAAGEGQQQALGQVGDGGGTAFARGTSLCWGFLSAVLTAAVWYLVCTSLA